MNRDELEERLRYLFQKSMQGDGTSYETFLELASGLIKRYLFKLGGKYGITQNTEDLLQEVLLTLHQKKHTYQLDRPILPWLYAITRHRYIDFYRSKKRLPQTISIDPEFEKTFGIDVPEPSHDMEEILVYLTEKQKDMLLMIKVEGATYQETARAFSMSVPAVKVGVHRILKALKGKLNHED